MKRLLKILIVMSLCAIWTSCLAKAPKGKLTYCSYSRAGSAGLGKDYCELIADPGETPKVVVALKIGNRFREPEIHAEYPVSQEVVDSLRKLLADHKVYQLNGYSVDEAITGGYAHRIYQEYDSGEKVNARWYGHDVKAEAWTAYRMIESFFEPWRSQAIRDNRIPVRCEVIVERVAGRGTDHYLLMAEPGSVPFVVLDLNVDNRLGKEEVHRQFDIDEEPVRALQQKLIGLGSGSLGDYKKDDALEGGTIYSIRLEYGPDDRQTLYWHTHDVDPAAQALFDCLHSFFTQWTQPL